MVTRKLGGEMKVSEQQWRENLKQIEAERCIAEEVHHAGEKDESYRRCMRTNGHEGPHSFSSWCLR